MAEEILPEGMGYILQSSGILENLMWIMSYEGLSAALYDDPELVGNVCDRVGELIYESYKQGIANEKVIGIFFGDDMGFKTSTMISPEHLRSYVFPWQKKLVDLCHEHNKIFILHACGNLEGVMDELIDYVGIDAKHSYEDTIEPVGSFKKRYGDCIGIVGGVDVDVLARSTPEDTAIYTRRVLDECVSDGGYALGSGNSVANYIPLENYFSMLREGARYRFE
jgi:uroporphyrinogen decarboxylase